VQNTSGGQPKSPGQGLGARPDGDVDAPPSEMGDGVGEDAVARGDDDSAEPMLDSLVPEYVEERFVGAICARPHQMARPWPAPAHCWKRAVIACHDDKIHITNKRLVHTSAFGHVRQTGARQAKEVFDVNQVQGPALLGVHGRQGTTQEL
jgi:hypothetical protein